MSIAQTLSHQCPLKEVGWLCRSASEKFLHTADHLEYSNLLMAVVLAIKVKFKYTNIIAPQYYLQRTLIRAGESTVFFTHIPIYCLTLNVSKLYREGLLNSS